MSAPDFDVRAQQALIHLGGICVALDELKSSGRVSGRWHAAFTEELNGVMNLIGDVQRGLTEDFVRGIVAEELAKSAEAVTPTAAVAADMKIDRQVQAVEAALGITPEGGDDPHIAAIRAVVKETGFAPRPASQEQTASSGEAGGQRP